MRAVVAFWMGYGGLLEMNMGRVVWIENSVWF
jgi:hypothetical protein